MNAVESLHVLTPLEVAEYNRQGFIIKRQLFSRAECTQMVDHFMDIRAQAPIKGHYEPLSVEEAGDDILKAYPRIMMPHRFDDASKQWLLDPRIMDVLSDLLDDAPLATQSMFYYKPPGAKGQALHQDNFYLRVKPGNCIAAWLAIEDTDAENGALRVVPKTHTEDIICPTESDMSKSFINHEVEVPSGDSPQVVNMAAGDCLFFGGNLIHGSFPNKSATRWRRSFICHYMPKHGEEIAKAYHPILDRAGNEVTVGEGPDFYEPCGGQEGNAA